MMGHQIQWLLYMSYVYMIMYIHVSHMRRHVINFKYPLMPFALCIPLQLSVSSIYKCTVECVHVHLLTYLSI